MLFLVLWIEEPHFVKRLFVEFIFVAEFNSGKICAAGRNLRSKYLFGLK